MYNNYHKDFRYFIRNMHSCDDVSILSAYVSKKSAFSSFSLAALNAAKLAQNIILIILTEQICS